MAKLTLSDVSNIGNPHSISNTIGDNNSLIEAAVENTLSRDGTSPNQMSADLDMNSNSILNLPAPTHDTEPIRLIDANNGISIDVGVTGVLDDLSDVIIASPSLNQVLEYDGTHWTNQTLTGSVLGSAPDSADYIVKTANAGLSAERVATDNTSVTWDFGTSGQAKLSRAALTGDITASSNSNATTIANAAVTYAKMQGISAGSTLLGRGSSGSGSPQEITLGSNLSMTGTTLSASTSSSQPLDSDLTALANNSIAGLWTVTGSGTGSARTITGTSNSVTVTNGDGVSGNPTLAVSSTYAGGTSIATLGTITAGVWNGTAVPVANGGTGATTASGARTNLGLVIGTDVQAFDAQLSSLVRQNSQSAAYTTVLTDGGKHIYHPSADTTARTWTIDSNANVAYPIGTAITFVNDTSGGVITIAITSDTLVLAGTGSTGSRSLAASGIATALKVTSTRWIISGTGLT